MEEVETKIKSSAVWMYRTWAAYTVGSSIAPTSPPGGAMTFVCMGPVPVLALLTINSTGDMVARRSGIVTHGCNPGIKGCQELAV